MIPLIELNSHKILINIICITALIIASYTDIKTREVPDWLNYSLIGLGLGINAIYSLSALNPLIIIQSILGLILGVSIGCLMFYTNQWGGGDSKMIMGLGTLIGLEIIIGSFFLGFLINILLVGSIYGLLWSLFLAIKNKKKFSKEMKKNINNEKLIKTRGIIFICSLLLLFPLLWDYSSQISIPIFLLIILINLTPYVWMFVKSVEKSSMYKYITPNKLTEGDWIAKKIRMDGRDIAGPKDHGIEKRQIDQLIRLWNKGKIKKILIKEGMPFIPSFLIAFIITLKFDNLFLIITKIMT